MENPPRAIPGTQPSPLARALLLVTVVLTGVNLRSFLTAVGPLAAEIGQDTGLSYQGMAWLTFLPVVLMGLGAFAGPWIGQRLGIRRSVLWALALLALGSGLRLVAPDGLSLLATAAMCGLGVAVVQALFPAIIKGGFSQKLAPVMGLYSAAMMGGGALGAELSPVVAKGYGEHGWHEALAWLALPCVIALGMAWVCLPKERPSTTGRRRTPLGPFLRRPRTWLLMACFGLVNGGYSSIVAWLAPFYQTHHWDSGSSGHLVAVMALAQAAAALTLPALAGENRDRRRWLWVALAMQCFGFCGLAALPEAAPELWAVLTGAGLGGFFALGLVVALDHLNDPEDAAALGALMQGGGFVIAALAP
ncbi:MAG: cyanate transporter, partial [Verrucomicrobium sp.]